MPETRELILQRLEAIIGGLGFASASRNKPILNATKLPAIALFDGDEIADDSGFSKSRANPAFPNYMTMQPEIFVVLEEGHEVVGTKLNACRFKVIHAILNDAELIALAADAKVYYRGFQSGLALGRSLEGEGGINFDITYVFDPRTTPDPDESTEEGTEESTEGP